VSIKFNLPKATISIAEAPQISRVSMAIGDDVVTVSDEAAVAPAAVAEQSLFAVAFDDQLMTSQV
jgi:hypothetical protein